MTDPKVIKVMIVDDHPVVRDGLKNMLDAFDDFELVGEAEDGNQALAICEQSQPEVILMDMFMPGQDGITATRAILKKFPDIRIVMLTSFVEEDLVQNALEAGVVSYLLKNAPIDRLAEAIRSAYAGQATLSPQATTALIRSRTAPLKPGQDLTKRELEVLALMVQGVSNEEIARQLVISPATARHHVSACLQKLGVTNRIQAAALATKYHLIS